MMLWNFIATGAGVLALAAFGLYDYLRYRRRDGNRRAGRK
jgi:hypothetical protein